MAHVPKLTGPALTQAIQAIQKLPMSQGAKTAVQLMLLEAALPDRHDPRRLGASRARLITAGETVIKERTQNTLSRAAHALLEMSEDEWQSLVADAAEEQTP